MFEKTRHRLFLSLCVAGLFSANTLQAEERYTLLDHRGPTGMAGRWSALTRPGIAGSPQPVRISLPGAGKITFFTLSQQGQIQIDQNSPALAGMGVGYVYRVCISDMPEYPGVRLYPTIEVLDRLHPPVGKELEFPIPIQVTAEEIETVMQDRMVTKVVYLEQPDIAFPVVQEGGARIENLPPTSNLIEAADRRGRPMAIVRIGGRIPSANATTDEFFSGSPLQILRP